MTEPIKLPPLPEWSKMDDLNGFVPSEIRQHLTEYATAAIEADRQQREKDLRLCEEALEVEIQHSRRLQKELDELKADRQARGEPINHDECRGDVFSHGVSIGLFDVPKETMNSICAGITAVTGAKVDWHYVGGRVHLKALPAPQPPQIPEGYKLAPIEPTDDMLNAARDWSDKKYGKPIGNDAAVGCFQAMLEAAPPPVEAGDQTGQKMPAIRMSTGSGGGDQDGGAA